ncbi:MAG TPA: ABC transporter permease, partial [Flavilitoribacter sp.]|nr:ABC transporter permease [Flavilitoribacter sp.]
MRIKIALRTQLRYKWFTLIHLLGLSLGIVCSLIILIYVESHLSTDTHHTDVDRICRVVLEIETPEGSTEYEEGSSLPMADALARDYSQVEAAAFCMKFYTAPTITVQARGKKDKYKEADIAAYADNGFLTLLDHQFLAGDKGSALINPLTAVLSEKQALKYFGTTDVVGRVLNINNNKDLTVTGVFADQMAASDFAFDLLVSLPTLKTLNPNYQDRNFSWVGSNNWTFVKLREGTALPEMNRAMDQFSEKYLGPDLAHWHFHFQPLAEVHFDPRFGGIVRKSLLWVLLGVALTLLMVVSVNYINLSVAQSQQRAKEIGIRKFLGGSRRQLFLQFMLETGILVLTAVGLAGGIVSAVLPAVNGWLQTDMSLLRLTEPDNLLYLSLFTAGLTLLAGYYPAVLLSGFDPLKALAGRVSGEAGGVG